MKKNERHPEDEEYDLNDEEEIILDEKQLKQMYYNSCLFPKWIRKNGSSKYIAIRCEKCERCKMHKIDTWYERIHTEIESGEDKQLVVLSINKESLDQLKEIVQNRKQELTAYKCYNDIATLAVRRYLERIRKKTGKSVKHWLVTEVTNSKTHRIKLRGMIFSEDKQLIIKHWQYGIVMFTNYITSDTLINLLKYLNNTNRRRKHYKPIILCSAGIGMINYKVAS